MATRSSIAIRYGDTIKAVYCHWDGYLEHNGFILTKCYNDSVSASKLISMGDISSLGATIGEQVSFDRERSDDDYVDLDGVTGVNKQCMFYTRDRGEETTWKSFGSVDEWLEHYEASWCEYFYLFEDGEWRYTTGNTFQSVAEGLRKEAA
jgi:hypothetical protein